MSTVKNNTAICIASGASLTKEDVEYCEGKGKVYAVKECAFLCYWANVLYAADTDWWEYTDRWQWFKGEKWTVSSEAAIKYGLNHIEYDNKLLWSKTQGLIASGGNSGFQALNLAALQGANKIILLGYDMGCVGAKHWFDDTMRRDSRASDYHIWIEHFNKAAPLMGIEVINCSRQSALTCFPKMELRDAL